MFMKTSKGIYFVRWRMYTLCNSVVSVGGDGTFSEVLNGLMERTNKDKGVEQNFRHKPARPGVRIGIIPAGRL